MLKYILSLLSLAGAALCVSAESVVCTPGSLKDSLTSPASVSQLSISGSVDASDLFFIASSMPALRSLDLSDVTIAEYNGTRLAKHTYYPANTIPEMVFAGSDINSIVFPTSGQITIASGAFAGCAVTSLEIPANVVSVGHGAFAGCNSLEWATIGSSTLYDGVFAYCTALESVTFTSSISLGANTFADCSSLTVVEGASEAISIGDRAFRMASSLTEFAFGPKLTSIGSEAFAGSGLHEVNLLNCRALTSIGSWAFARMPELSSIRLNGSAGVSEGMVFDCPKLSEISINGSHSSLPAYAYAKNSALQTLSIADGVSEIGDYALSGLSNIDTISIPSSVEYIGSGAMERMTALTSISSASETVPDLGDDVWDGVNQSAVTLYVPASVQSDYSAAEQWSEFRVMAMSNYPDIELGEPLGQIKGRIVGDEIQISVAGVDLAEVAVFDTAGLLLASVHPADEFVSIDIAGWQQRIFLVSATLADGSKAALKLAR